MTTYQRIAVATDPVDDGPAITLAAELGAHLGALELIAVSPNRSMARLDRVRLERLAANHGWVPAACTVLVGDHVPSTLARHLGRRDHTLLVVASNDPSFGIEHAATRIASGDQPILVVGDHVDPHRVLRPGATVILVDEVAPDPDIVEAVVAWVTTFGADVWAVHTTSAADELSSESGRWVDALSRNRLTIARHETLGSDPVERVFALVSDIPGAVIVAPAAPDHGPPEIVAQLFRSGSVPLLLVPSGAAVRASDERLQRLTTAV